MTEPSPNAQEGHLSKFLQVSKNLKSLAEQLVAQHPEFPPGDFGRAYLAVAITLMLGAAGNGTTAAYLRHIADGLESGAPGVN
jgi:hypothetical protein